MTEFVEAVASPLNLLWVVLIFGVAPGLVLRLLVLLYPKDDPRRRELVAELYTQGRMERLLWVGEQVETAIVEGLSARWTQRSRGRNHRITGVATLIGWASVVLLVLQGYELLIPNSTWVWRPNGWNTSDWIETWATTPASPIAFAGVGLWSPIFVLPGGFGVTGLTIVMWTGAGAIVGVLIVAHTLRRRSFRVSKV